jgi:hypothetical protein
LSVFQYWGLNPTLLHARQMHARPCLSPVFLLPSPPPPTPPLPAVLNFELRTSHLLSSILPLAQHLQPLYFCSFSFFLSFFFFLLVGLGLELRASHLQSRCSTTCDITPVHFALVIFGGEGSLRHYLPWLALSHDPPDLSFPNS